MEGYGGIRRHVAALPLEACMLLGGVVMVLQHDWFHLGTVFLTTTASFAPLLFERAFQIRLPVWLQFTYVFFVFASMFSGEVLRFYRHVPGWDEVIHFTSGLLIGFAVILWVRLLIRNRQLRMPLGLQVFFVVCVTVFVAVVWEVIEFTSDQLFGTTSQDRSLFDTMTDLIYGGVGAWLMTLYYTWSLRRKDQTFLDRAIESFEAQNR